MQAYVRNLKCTEKQRILHDITSQKLEHHSLTVPVVQNTTDTTDTVAFVSLKKTYWRVENDTVQHRY